MLLKYHAFVKFIDIQGEYRTVSKEWFEMICGECDKRLYRTVFSFGV
jgi:uncharacterized protein YhaN